ncbi:hypothetical protein LTR08_008380 [Meristemomyces frigidus]|nr:hypothetical protein LTR08_008380 [Meristemomyces frigidus]
MYADGERSPKRQRLESYSPASPPVPETKPFVHQPHTPPPSVHMSPEWQSQALTAEQRGGPGSVTLPTPPSTAGFLSQQKPFSGDEAAKHAQQTLASESGHKDGDGDAEMVNGDGSGATVAVNDDVSMTGMAAADAEHRRTDHERHAAPHTTPDMPPPPAPRLYMLRTETIAPSRPHPAQNAIELYSLQKIQASVARRDAAGNKINKLRKSYEGKVKQLGLEGRSKAHVGDGALAGLLHPDYDWDMGGGMTLWDQQKGELPQLGGDMSDLLAKLGAATSLRPGQMPKQEHKEWKDLLSLDEPAKNTPAVLPTKPGLLAQQALARSAPGLAARASAPSSPRSALGRPERAGKKRRYDDSSFDGYTQTFDEDGYSTGGVDDARSRRGSGGKRAKSEQQQQQQPRTKRVRTKLRA